MPGNHQENAYDGRWGWMIVMGGFYNLFMWAGFLRCLSVFFNPLMLEFDVEYGEVSRLTGLFQIGYGIFGSICPFMLKHFETRQVCMAASITSGVSCFIASMVNDLWTVQIFFGFVVGCSMGLLLNSTFTMTARYFERRHHTANQLVCLGISVGPFVLCPGFQMLLNAYGWRGACQIISGILLNTAVASSLMRSIKLTSDPLEEQITSRSDVRSDTSKESTSSKKECVELRQASEENICETTVVDVSHESPSHCSSVISSQNPTHEDQTDHTPSNGRGFYKWVLRVCRKYHLDLFLSPLFYEFAFSWTWYSIAFYATLTYMIPYGVNVIKLSEIEASALITAFSGGEIFSRVVYSIVFDKIPRRFRILHMVGLFTLTSLSMFLFAFIKEFTGALILCAVVGILAGGTEAIYNTILAQSFNVEMASAALGYSNVIYCVVDSIAIVIIGATVDGFGNYIVPFYIGCGSAAIASLVMYKLHRSVTQMRGRKTAGRFQNEEP